MSKTRRLQIVVWLFLGIFTSSVSGQWCGPARIGESYNITTTVTVPPDQSVQWQLNFNDGLGPVVFYDSTDSSKPNKFPEFYFGTRTELAISKVRKEDREGAFQHLINGTVAYTCVLPVFKTASEPICDNVTLTGNNITTKCTTYQVFPQARCHFTLLKGAVVRYIPEESYYITYTHRDPMLLGTEYYSTTCRLQYPIKHGLDGAYKVRVVMYPNLTGVSVAQGGAKEIANSIFLTPSNSTVMPETKEKDSCLCNVTGLVGIVIGVFLGTLVLVAVMALIVFLIRRKKAENKNGKRDASSEYDGLERPPPLPKHTSQTAADYIEPIEPDPSAYSYIHAN